MFNSGHRAPQFNEAIKKRLIVKRTSQSFILADSSKFGASSNDNDSQIAKETKIICP